MIDESSDKHFILFPHIEIFTTVAYATTCDGMISLLPTLSDSVKKSFGIEGIK